MYQHMRNVKKSVAERTHHQRQYDRRVNKRQMQTQENKVDMGKALDDGLVVTKAKTSPRSYLRWKPTGRILKVVGLRWIPTGKLLDSCTSKVDCGPPHGSSVDISKIHDCKQTLDLSTVVLKSFAVTTADASNKHQQQPDSTSSTSTLATTFTAKGKLRT
ncbi:hypothetical protein Tco_0098190 [Tanacetum coccineum]